MSAIKNISAKQKLDLRGNPTLKILVELESGHSGVMFAPFTLGADSAVNKDDILNDMNGINQILFESLKGKDIRDQQGLDKIILNVNEKYGNPVLGKEAIAGVSIALAKAAASYCKLPFYRYIGGANIKTTPIPLSTVLRGGVDVNNKLNIKEFMLVPVGFLTFGESLDGSLEVFNKLGEVLEQQGISTNIQNGYISNLNGDEQALELICDAIDECGYIVGEHFFIGLNVAASEWEIQHNIYRLPKQKERLTSEQFREYMFDLCQKYPIISLEDPLGGEDFEGYMELTSHVLDVQIAGNSIFAASLSKLQKAIYRNIANAVVINSTEMRTLSEFMNLVELARQAGYNVIMSDRSMKKENSLIADIVFGLGIKQVKIGMPSKTNEFCKCKRFLEQEHFFDDRLHPISYWKYY